MQENKVLNAVLRNDFNSFINKVFNTINPGTQFELNWHINLIAESLEAVRKGEIKRLIINLPPRSLKSICVSVAWPAWLLAHNPTSRIIAVSYSQILSIKHSLDCRFILDSKWYKSIFPNTCLNKHHNQKSKFLTSLNGFRFASSIGGSLTGEGGDFLIIDDPHNPLHIHSVKRRNQTIDWFEQVFLSRLNDKAKGAIIIVMQRLHHEDLSGYLLANHKSWQQIKIPSESVNPLKFNINNNIFDIPSYRLLHATRDDITEIEYLKQSMGSKNFNAQYLQEPEINNEALLKLDNISFYNDLPTSFEYYIQSWDTAINISSSSDYSVCSCFGVLNNRYYLIKLFRDKLTYPFLKKEVYNLQQQFKPRYILIENKASGQQLLQELIADNISSFIGCKPIFDKLIRFSSILNDFHLGKILLPSKGEMKNLILNEITKFPQSKNDDIVDSISQFLIFMRNQFDKKVTPRIRNF